MKFTQKASRTVISGILVLAFVFGGFPAIGLPEMIASGEADTYAGEGYSYVAPAEADQPESAVNTETAAAIFAPSSAALTAPDDKSVFNGCSYKVFDQAMNWSAAKAYCESLGGHLATITSSEERVFAESIAKNGSLARYWLGGTDEGTEGDWLWITGEPWAYEYWASGQPDNAWGGQNYLLMDGPGRGWAWDDSRVDEYSGGVGFICEWDYVDTPDEPNPDFVVQDGILIAYSGPGGVITIPDGVAEIAGSVFRNNTTIIGVAFNEGLLRIGNYAFAGCANLLSLTLNQGLLTIGDYAFYGDNKISGALTIPDTVTSIGQYAFANCASFTGNLVIPGSVTTIGNGAFANCTGLNGTLTLSYGILTIGQDAFYGCSKLTGDLIIPDSVTSLGNSGAFYSCSGFNGRLKL
ncbi:MAG: leucine-rich repeat protein, partial [Firmicutes bacterium]|nr:leucine-rich repeat protein [Bacillota bacterium]